MKKIYILFAVLTILTTTGCTDFLNLKPRDTKIVSTIEDYRDIMASYMRLLTTPNPSQKPVFGSVFLYPEFDMASSVGMYTGELTMSKTSTSYFDKTINKFTTLGIGMQTWTRVIGPWSRYYSFLGPINLVVKGVQIADGDDEHLRQSILGEALVWRAFSYFKLTQYYAPYNDNKYGIPIFLDPTDDVGNAMPERKTLKECYAQVLGDLNKAMELYEKTVFTKPWNVAFNPEFMNSMLASIYTYKALSAAAEPNDWGKAEEHATKAMEGRVLTNDPAVIKQMFDCSPTKVMEPMTHDEFTFRLMDGSEKQVCNFISAYKAGNYHSGVVPREYADLYSANDIRKAAYFINGVANKYNINGQSAGGCIILYRLAEMYLIKAEALLRQNKLGEARTALEAFCSKRYTIMPTIPTDKDNLLKAIIDERKREFYMENDFRWLDMKRLGVVRELMLDGEMYKLEADDFRYSFPIPQRELEYNMKMVQTPGWETIVLF